MIVLLKCPTWKLLAMFGLEYSSTTFFPFPDVFDPYSGFWEGVSCERVWTWVRTARVREAVLHMKWRKALSCWTEEMKSSAWN